MQNTHQTHQITLLYNFYIYSPHIFCVLSLSFVSLFAIHHQQTNKKHDQSIGTTTATTTTTIQSIQTHYANNTIQTNLEMYPVYIDAYSTAVHANWPRSMQQQQLPMTIN